MKIINKDKNIFKLLIPLILVIIVIATATIIVVAKRKTVTILTNGNAQKIVTYKDSVKDVLKANNIILDGKDKITPPITTKVIDKQVIKIKKAIHVKVYLDNKILSLKSAESNIEKLFKSEKIILKTNDLLTPSINTPLTEGLNIKIVRVKTKIYQKLKPIAFNTTTKIKSSLPNTVHKVIYEGYIGEKQYTIKEVYHDNKLFTKNIIGKAIIKKPRDKIIVQGSYPVMPVSKTGKILSYYKKLRVRATAYWAVRGIGRTFTGSGRMAIRNPNGYSTIAVDKHLFAYGTRLFIEGYGFAVAADTGTAIIGNTIDVYFDTRQEARGWAVRHPLVYVLKN